MTTVNIGKVRPTWKSTYDSGTTYTYLDFVTYNNVVWFCLQTSTGNTPVEGAYWTSLASYVALGETSESAYRGDRGKTAYDHSQVSHANVFATGTDGQLSRQMLIDCGYTFLDKGNSSTTTQTLDYTAGSHQKITATGNFTIALSNFPPTGNLGELLLELVNGGSQTITFPTISWIKPDGTTTTSISDYLTANVGRTALQTSGTDFILIWSRDGGTTVYGGLV